MNNTKWHELQMAMYDLKENHPKWLSKCIDNEYISQCDGEWYYHFSEGGFKDLEWVEIKIENGYRIYGYIQDGKSIDYIYPYN